MCIEEAGISRPQQQIVRNSVIEGGEVEICDPVISRFILLTNSLLESSICNFPTPKKEDALTFSQNVAENLLEDKRPALRKQPACNDIGCRL